jgi:hypothetical protein
VHIESRVGSELTFIGLEMRTFVGSEVHIRSPDAYIRVAMCTFHEYFLNVHIQKILEERCQNTSWMCTPHATVLFLTNRKNSADVHIYPSNVHIVEVDMYIANVPMRTSGKEVNIC